jgi:internalin A
MLSMPGLGPPDQVAVGCEAMPTQDTRTWTDFPEIVRQAAREGWKDLALTPYSNIRDDLVGAGWQADRVLLVSEPITDDGARALASLTGLNRLDLSHSHIGNDGASSLADLISLTTLGLSHSCIGDDGARALASLTGLTTLALSGNRIGDDGARALASLTGLTGLDLCQTSVGDEGASALASLTRLTTLDLRCNSIGDEGAKALASLAGLTSLDLSYNSMSGDGARALAGLTRLTSLDLSYNRIGDGGARALASLTGLTTLRLLFNRIQADGARALARLTELTTLDLSGNRIGDDGARALASLTGLTRLYLEDNRIGDDGAKALASLTGLTTLALSGNRIGDDGAQALASLTGLTGLYLEDNRIGDDGAKALASLTGLTALDIRSNCVGDDGATALLDSAEQSHSIKLLELRYNPVALLPDDVLAQHLDVQAILSAYRRYRTSVRVPLNEAKLLVIGNEAVGKTSLVRFLVHRKPRDPDEKKTPGIQTERIETQGWSPSGTGPRLSVWDFGGQEIMHQTHKFFLTERSIYLLVLEDRREDDRSVVPWLRTIANHGGDSPVLVVVNKCDGGPPNLRLDEIQLLRGWPAVVGVFRTSCNDDEHAIQTIEALKSKLVALLNEHPKLKHVRDEIPVPWRRVKEAVARLAEKNKVLSREDFERLCAAGEGKEAVTDPDEQRALLRLLHDLGVVVAHGFERRATVIEQSVTLLDPNWLTGAIYKVLTNCLVAKHGGVFARGQLAEMLDPAEYSGNRADFVLTMMEHRDVGLCFRLPDTKQGDERFLVPEALPVSEPFLGKWSEEVLRFRIAYEFLPRGLVPRFIVQSHKKLAAEGARWRTGVVLRVSECNVLVQADPERRIIDITVDGPPGMRRSALDVVREDLAFVHELNPEAKPRELVPLPDNRSVDVAYEHLRKLEDRYGRDHEFLPQGAEREYRVSELLDGVRDDRRAGFADQLDVWMTGNLQNRDRDAPPAGEPNHWVLLLSDLHVGVDTQVDTLFQSLVEDLRSGPAARSKLSAMVVAGDLTNRASVQEFDRATDLILRLGEILGISANNTVVVPGNHDLDWEHAGVYKLHEGPRPPGLTDDEYFPSNDHALVRDSQSYRESFGNFATHAYSKLYGRPYPLDPAQQVDVFDLEASGLCFVAFNSAWNTAERSPHAATIVDAAVNEASRRLEAIEQSRFKIAVWHHPITGNEKIQNDAFVERLRNLGVRLCLHGHIHESRTDLLGCLHPRKMLAIGTGSFGAPWKERAESTPRLYQLLEIASDRRSVRVYTRGLKKLGGAWGPWYEWHDPADPDKRQASHKFAF